MPPVPAKVVTRGRVSQLRFAINAETLRRVRDIPGQLGYVGRDIRFTPSVEAFECIAQIFPGAEYDASTEALRSVLIKREEAKRTASADFQFAVKTAPFKHQQEIWNRSRDMEAFALLMEQGTGKTKVTIDTAAWKYSQGEILGMLVIAPNGVHRNWITDEIPVHMPDWCKVQCAVWTAQKGTRALKKLLDNKERGLKVFAINSEALSTTRGFEAATKFLSAMPCLVAIDEATWMKNLKAKRTKNALKLRALAPVRRILTGTIVTKGPLDVFSPFSFLDEDILGYSSFVVYRKRYAILKPMEKFTGEFDKKTGEPLKRKFEVPVGWRNIEELSHKIKPYSARVLKKDCLDLPDKLYVRRPFELSDEVWEHYQRMECDFETEFQGRYITAAMAMVRQMRLSQIACGYLPSENPEVDPGVMIGSKNNRIESLLEGIQELNGSESKIMILAPWRASLRDIFDAIRKEWGSASVIAYGGQMSKQTDDQRAEEKRRFQEDAKVRFWVGQDGTSSKGHTLVQASWMFYFCQRNDLEIRLQSEDRMHRIGQRNPCTYFDIEAQYQGNYTTDRDVIDALKRKKDIADQVNGDPALAGWMAEQIEAIDHSFFARYGFKPR